MTYYIHPIWFYLMDICESFKGVSLAIAIVLFIFTLGGILIICGIVTESDFSNLSDREKEEQNKWLKKFKVSTIFAIIFMCLFCVTPTKEGVTKMMIASVVTYENVEMVKGDAKEIIDYITEKAVEIKSDKKEE